jgi:hypothetical protein
VVVGNSGFYLGGVIMQWEIFLHFQEPDLGLFSFLELTIESWWLDLPEFTLQDVYLKPSPLPSGRRHTWVSPWP